MKDIQFHHVVMILAMMAFVVGLYCLSYKEEMQRKKEIIECYEAAKKNANVHCYPFLQE